MNEHRLTSASDAKDFVLGGNSTFTVVSAKTGSRFTFKVKEVETGAGKFFVGLLNGQDNHTDYCYMGMLDGEGHFRTTAKSRVAREAPSMKALQYTLHHLFTREQLPEQLEFWHEGRCGRCGRKLTVPESIESGFGPYCRGQM